MNDRIGENRVVQEWREGKKAIAPCPQSAPRMNVEPVKTSPLRPPLTRGDSPPKVRPQEGFPLKETVPTLSGPVVVRRTFPPLILASKGIWGAES